MKARFWDLVDRMCEKAEVVRAVGDVLSVVEAHELEPATLRTLGVLLLQDAGFLLEALERIASMKSGSTGSVWVTSGSDPLSEA